MSIRRLAIGTTLLSFSASMSLAAITPTAEYNADSGVLPNAAGQLFEGGFATTNYMAIVDMGGGDMALSIDTQDTDSSAYFEISGSPPGYLVSAATGFSVEWRVKFDDVEGTEPGGADLIFADELTFTALRLSREANGGAAQAVIKSGLNNDILATIDIDDPGAFHTYRIDKVGTVVDLYIDGVPVATGINDPQSSPYGRVLRLGDGTSFGDGHTYTKFLRIYANGVIPEPASLTLLALGGAMIAARRR